MDTANALERTAHFIGEQRTVLYRAYCSGVAQLKNVLGAKKTLQGQALLGIERFGA